MVVPRGTGLKGLGAGGGASRGALTVAVAVILTQQGEVRLVFRLVFVLGFLTLGFHHACSSLGRQREAVNRITQVSYAPWG